MTTPQGGLIVIPSRQRSQYIMSHPLIGVATVLVAESEAATYRKLNIKVEEHPNLPNIGKIRQWALELARRGGYRYLFMSDDDIRACVYTFSRATRKVEDVDEMLEIIDHVALAAEDAGSMTFGFNGSTNPLYRFVEQPVILRGTYPGFHLGVTRLGLDTIRFDEVVNIEDYDACLQSIQYTGLSWRDQRWCWVHPADLPGGNTDMDSYEQILGYIETFRNRWGPAIVRPGPDRPNGAPGFKLNLGHRR